VLSIWRTSIGIACLAAMSAWVCGAERKVDDAQTGVRSGAEVRRVWVLSDSSGYGSYNRTREIMVYDLICEEGKMTRVSEGFATTSGPKFGEGWVLRVQAPLTAAAAEEQLKKKLADICGI
jgi:hypothetical protein